MIFFINSNKQNSEYLQRLAFDIKAEKKDLEYYSVRGQGSVFSKKNIIYLGPSFSKKTCWFSLCISALSIFYFFWLHKAARRGLKTLILCGIQEKILFTKMAVRMGIHVVFLECPYINYNALTMKIRSKYLQVLTVADVYCFGSVICEQLEKLGADKIRMKLMLPAFAQKMPSHQDSIFTSMAERDKEKTRKQFVIGTIVDLNSKHQVETALRSFVSASSFADNMQFIIIGDGTDRKDFIWLAKKLGIGDKVWFVGEQSFLQKWLENIDLYLCLDMEPGLDELLVLTKVIGNEIPVIGFLETGIDDYIKDKENGFLLPRDDVELLSASIMDLFRNIVARKKMGKRGKELLDSLAKMSDSKNIISQI